MNGTHGLEGFVPSALVFGKFPSLRTFTGPQVPQPTLAERGLAVQEVAQLRVKGAFSFQNRPTTDRIYQPGDKVLIRREPLVENLIGEWVDPYTVISFEETSRIILMQQDPDSETERYHITPVKPCIHPEENVTSFLKTLNFTFAVFALSNI